MKRIILLITLFFLSSTSVANELQTRRDIGEQVKDLVLSQKYSQLEAMAKEFREKELRTPSGLWMLTLFYGAIDKINTYQEKDPQAWEPFHKKIEASKEVLVNSKELSSQDPHWYVVMANIATIQSWKEEEFQVLVREGLIRNKYYFQLYFDIMGYYTPKWHGSAEKIEAFARNTVEKTKEKEGAGMYARIYWAASQSQFQGRLFENSNVRWGAMSKGIDDVLKKYPDQWNINNLRFFLAL